MAILNVGPGQQYTSISAAVRAAKDGDVVQVQAGTYTNDYPEVWSKITLVGVGGMVKMVSTIDPIPNGKAIMVTNTDVTIENFEFSGARASTGNGAGIRYQGGDLVLKDCKFVNNEMGVLSAWVPDGTITVDRCEFAGTAQNTKGILGHQLYVGNVAQLTVTNSYFHDAQSGGHQIKSRATKSVIENNRIVDGSGASSYSIDLPNGGQGIIKNNVIVQGVNQTNPNILHYGGEAEPWAGSSLVIAGNTIVNESSSSGVGLHNQTNVTASLSGNSLYKVGTLATGPLSDGGNTTLSTKPGWSTASPIDPSVNGTGTSTPTEPTPTPTEPTPTGSTGTSGNDTLSGTGGEKTMKGLAGNDTYVVDSSGDLVVELAGQGVDTVLSSITYKLSEFVENLTLTGTAAINGTGTAYGNVMLGNDAANRMWGQAGDDTMKGNAGNDELVGGLGKDVLTGGSGADKFTYYAPVDGTAVASNVTKGTVKGDTITDFQSGVDKIVLDYLSFKMTAGTTVEGVNIVHINTAYNGANAGGSSQWSKGLAALIVDSTGTLYHDANGKAAGYTVLTTVQPGANIHASDVVIA